MAHLGAQDELHGSIVEIGKPHLGVPRNPFRVTGTSAPSFCAREITLNASAGERDEKLVTAYYPKCRTDISHLAIYFDALVCHFTSWAIGNPATEIEARLIIAKKSAGIGKAEPIVNPEPFWQTVRADVARLREEDLGLRALVRGIISQGFQALLVYRIFRWFHERGIPTQPIRFFIERFTEITTGISIPVQVRIGKGLRIHHFGGIIVHSEAVIGESCTIYHGVTLGDLGGWGGAPRIGNHVVIGAGAKILGQIEVGNYCRVGANAVVRTSVPAGCLAVGVPAVIKQPVAASMRSCE